MWEGHERRCEKEWGRATSYVMSGLEVWAMFGQCSGWLYRGRLAKEDLPNLLLYLCGQSTVSALYGLSIWD